MLRLYLFQPVTVNGQEAGLCLSVGVLHCTVWLPEHGCLVVPTRSLRFIYEPELRRIVRGVLSRLPGCPISYSVTT